MNNFQSENQQLKQELEQLNGLLEYERNKCAVLLQTQAREITDEIKDILHLELQGISDIAQYLNEADRNRILRRLSRINQYLDDYSNAI